MTKVPLQNPKPDIENFVKVIRGETVPRRPPLVELFLDFEIEREISQTYLGREYPFPTGEREGDAVYLKNRIEVYYRMGYDYLRVSGGLHFPGKLRTAADTSMNLPRQIRGWAEEGVGVISSWADFESYPWPDPAKSDLWAYEFVADSLPEGMGLFVCPTSGFLEVPLGGLMGYENLCYLIYDDPELVAAVFQRTAEAMCGLYERLAGLPNLRGLFQGDDMGYKTGTLIGPDELRKYVLPSHKKLADLAHERGLIYILHCCGSIDDIMPDLIDDVGIDARHSFEDEGNPIQDFKLKYGDRVAALGGVDIDKLCRLPEDQLRAHTRKIIEECMPGGRFALGSGNTVCNYVPVRNYMAMVEEGLNFA
ncbi:MAG: uroporphyrinogen decarboxylase family protein [Armatimonadota bacterium]|nr:uroporphyrinogen decarboxylase family protein [Armatimonadota bacterium]